MKRKAHLLSQSPVTQVTERIVASGKITRADETVLLQASGSETPLTPVELERIRQVMDRLEMGLIRVVD
jgi:hypothetical protein